MVNNKIEVEDDELLLENDAGDKVIIPKNKSQWVKKKIKEGCYSCIDKLVEKLPIMDDYAQDGSVYTSQYADSEDKNGFWDEAKNTFQQTGEALQDTYNTVKSTFNPKNIGVERYDENEYSFDDAFERARMQGSKEFIWNNTRYNTTSDMPENKQKNIYGNVDDVLQAEAAPFTRPKERASNTIAPKKLTNVSHEYIMKNYVTPFLKGETPEGNVLTKESIPHIYGQNNIDPQIDMFRQFMGLDQHYDTMVKSSNEDEENTYDFKKEYKNKIIEDLQNSYGGFNEVVKAHDLDSTKSNVFDHKTVGWGEAQKSDKTYTGEATTLYPLGRHTEIVKHDSETGERYIEYQDLFDLNPNVLKQIGMGDILNKLNNPFKIKGRLYESDFSNIKNK